MSDDNNTTVKLKGVQATAAVGEVKLRQKSNFAVQHLMAAARFSRMCGDIEKENEGQPLGSFYEGQIACVSATVMLCVASLESNVNEYLSEPDSLFPGLTTAARQDYSDLIGEIKILEKYQQILSINGIEKFDEGARPFQDVATLIILRNEFVHFHPEWHDEQRRHKKLGERLLHLFDLSPFISEDSGVIFPQRIISHGCTRWAVESSLCYMKEFSEKIGKIDKFKKFEGKLLA